MKKLMLIISLLIALIVSLPVTLAATQNLIYDANGNLITGDGKYRIYDGFNHLVQIKNGNGATGTILENITWDPLEERTLVKAVYETNGSWKETVYYFTKEFVRVKNSSGTYDYKYIYQNGQLVAQELVGGQKNFMLNDHKGTIQVVTNESGAKVEETFYSPFGEIISGGATSRFDYEGKEYDSVVGDYDYHARKYLTGPHIFGQPDTMLPNVYDPQQLNRYTFERNNPYKYTDEDGNNPLLAYSFGAGLLAGAAWYWYNTPIDYNNPQWINRFKMGMLHGLNWGVNFALMATGGLSTSGGLLRATSGLTAKNILTGGLGAASIDIYDSLIDENRINNLELGVDIIGSALTAGIGPNMGGQLVPKKNYGISKQVIKTLQGFAQSETVLRGVNWLASFDQNLVNIQYNNAVAISQTSVTSGGGIIWGSSGSDTNGNVVTTNTGATLDASPGMQNKLREAGLL